MNIQQLSNTIKSLNGHIYIVGGAVRDEVMAIAPHDYDFVVVGIKQSDFESAFPDAKLTGKSFPVYRIKIDDNEVEVAFARKERKTAPGHNGFEVIFDESVTLKDDLYRRDLTFNALAKDLDTGEIIDFFNGLQDIKNKLINPVSEHFLEDPLRALRAARFSAKLNFSISEYGYEMMRKCKQELADMSQERIFGELEKALASPRPSLFFNALKQADLLAVTFPFIYDLIGKEQSIEMHPEGDAYSHTMLVLDKVSLDTDKLEVRFAALMHDIGKGKAELLDDKYDYRFHDKEGVEIIKNLPGAYPNSFKQAAMATSLLHMRCMKVKKAGRIFNIFKILKKYHFSANNLAIVMKRDSFVPLWLNNDVFDQVMKTKISIPQYMTDGEMIKEFVESKRIRILKEILVGLEEKP